MTNKEKMQILNEARKLIADAPEMEVRAPLGDIARDPWPEPPPEPLPRRPKLDTAPAAQTDWPAIQQYVEERIEQRIEQKLAYLSEFVGSVEALGEALDNALKAFGKEVSEANAAARVEHHKAVGDLRAAQEKELLQLRKGLNDLVVAVSKLAAYEQNRAAAIDLAAMTPTRRSEVN